MKEKLCLAIFSIICLTLTLQVIEASNQKVCSNNPAEWCTNIDEAEACNVVEQCWKYVWSDNASVQSRVANDADLVNFSLYYESLCGPCHQFITTQIWQAFQSVSSIMNLTLVPYGNAREKWVNETQTWNITCQHGPKECWVNQIHTCMIYFYPNTADHLPFIYCMETNIKDMNTNVHKVAEKCASQLNIPYGQLHHCMSTRLGNVLEHEMAVRTETLDPPHLYTPWMTLNGVHSKEIDIRARTDLIGLICDAYTGVNKPDACKRLSSSSANDICPNDFYYFFL